MKASKLLLLPILALGVGLSTGCSTGDKRTLISYGTLVHNKAIEIESYEELVLKLNRGENMIVATYKGGLSETCGCWVTFSGILNRYVDEYDTVIYKIDRNLIEGRNETFGITFVNASDPSLLIFKDGKLNNQYLDGRSTSKMFDTIGGLRDVLSKITRDPQAYYVNYDYVLENLKKEKEILIHYIWNFCSDCNYCFPNFFQPYLQKNTLNKKLWIMDLAVPGLLLDDEGDGFNPDLTKYNDFLKYCEMTEEVNPKFGYGKGYVPTTQYWENGTLIDANVYFNDKIEQNDKGEWVIVQSYFTEERAKHLQYTDEVLLGKIIPEKEVIEGIWMQGYAAVYHNALLKAFLDKYSK
jgi:hypothetical protein